MSTTTDTRSVPPTTTATPVTLTEVRAALTHAITILGSIEFEAAEAASWLEAADEPLAERIERNRQRSERARTGHNGNGNGHHSDVALKLTAHGLVLQCRKCGRPVA